MSARKTRSRPTKRGGRKARKRILSPPENRKIIPDPQEGEKTRGIFPPLLFSGGLRKSIIKNMKKYNSFRCFVEYLPVFDTPLRPFPTAVGFVRWRGGTAGCVGDGAQRVRQVVVAAGCAGAGERTEHERVRNDGLCHAVRKGRGEADDEVEGGGVARCAFALGGTERVMAGLRR